MTVKEVYA